MFVLNLQNIRTLLCLAMLLQLGVGRCHGQTESAKNWQVKTNLTGFLSNTISFEVERAIGDDFALTLQVGAIINVLDPQPNHVFEGYLLRIGGKKYLLQQNREVAHTGLAVKAELHYSHWRDWYTNLRGNTGDRWENSIGGLLTVSYSHMFGKMVFIEPYLGIGYIPTWQNLISFNDSPPYETTEINWSPITSPERRFSYFSHFWIAGNFVFAPGVSLGLRF